MIRIINTLSEDTANAFKKEVNSEERKLLPRCSLPSPNINLGIISIIQEKLDNCLGKEVTQSDNCYYSTDLIKLAVSTLFF